MMKLNLPIEWAEIITLDAFSQISTTGKKVKTAECNQTGKYPVIDQGQLAISGYIDDPSKLITIKNPIILFGDHTRAIKWINFDFVPGADGTKLLETRSFIEPRFAFYQLLALEIPDKGYSRHFKYLKEVVFRVPPLAEQKIITHKLDELLAQVDTLKARLDAIPAILKRFRQSVLAAAVSGKLTEEWRRLNNISAPELTMLDSIINTLDQGWSPKCINTPAEKNVWGVIKTSAIQAGFFVPEENKTLPTNLVSRKNLALENGDLLITRAGPRNRCGITCIVEQDHPNLMICDKVYRIRFDTQHASPRFINWCLNSPKYLESIERLKTGSSESGMNMTQKKLRVLEILLPNLNEQTEIVRRVEQLFTYADQVEQQVKNAQARVNQLTQSILAKAFRGDLTEQWRQDNPELISGDNSAAALLERIKTERAAATTSKKKAPARKAKA